MAVHSTLVIVQGFWTGVGNTGQARATWGGGGGVTFTNFWGHSPLPEICGILQPPGSILVRFGLIIVASDVVVK